MVMINFHAKLKPALKNKAKSFFAPSAATTSASPDKCTNQEGCPMYQSSFFTLEPNLSTIGKVPTNTSILILNGESDTQTPVQGALLLQQRLTQIRHPRARISPIFSVVYPARTYTRIRLSRPLFLA
jgi:uncharacterized protein